MLEEPSPPPPPPPSPLPPSPLAPPPPLFSLDTAFAWAQEQPAPVLAGSLGTLAGLLLIGINYACRPGRVKRSHVDGGGKRLAGRARPSRYSRVVPQASSRYDDDSDDDYDDYSDEHEDDRSDTITDEIEAADESMDSAAEDEMDEDPPPAPAESKSARKNNKAAAAAAAAKPVRKQVAPEDASTKPMKPPKYASTAIGLVSPYRPPAAAEAAEVPKAAKVAQQGNASGADARRMLAELARGTIVD